MTRNLRTQLADAAERWMRAWAGDNLPRESAEVLYTYWDLADPHDDDLRAEVLSRFPAAEPPSVPGLDWLPAVEADAKQVVAEVVAKRPPWSAFGPCERCGVAAGEQCVFTRNFLGAGAGSPRQVAHNGRPLVEVQPEPVCLCGHADADHATDPRVCSVGGCICARFRPVAAGAVA